MYEVTNFVMGKGMDNSEQPGRRERKRTQQLDHFATTAWSLFEAEGYEAVTMERIADVALFGPLPTLIAAAPDASAPDPDGDAADDSEADKKPRRNFLPISKLRPV